MKLVFGKPLLGVLLVLCAIGVASAIIITGIGYSMVTFVSSLNYGQMGINEEKTMTLGYVNTTVTDQLQAKVTCLASCDSITAKLIKPAGSDSPLSLAIPITNGTVTINEANRTLESGPIRLQVTINRQGNWTFGVEILNTSTTQVLFVDTI